MTKPPYQINSSLRKNYPAHHPQESGGGMVDDVVPISLGGTGATTAEGARDNLGTNDASNLTTGTLPNARVSNSLPPDKAFRRGNILGTVAQSGGAPTGAIIERGSNANGEYVRFADGTQICWRQISHNFATENRQDVDYPASFSNLPGVVAAFTPQATSSSTRISAYINSIVMANRSNQTWGFYNSATVNETLTVSLYASGRWF